jgi:Rieske Fe-S protein
MKEFRVKRRDFCLRAVQLTAVAGVADMLQACGGGGPTSPSLTNTPQLTTISGSVANGVVTVPISASSPLASVGSAALVQTSVGMFLVARTADSAFSVLTATCTHQECTITGFQNATYVCPCHGSTYNTSGVVLGGPAPRSLRQYPSQFASDTLTWSA